MIRTIEEYSLISPMAAKVRLGDMLMDAGIITNPEQYVAFMNLEMVIKFYED